MTFDEVYRLERQPMLRVAYLIVGSTDTAEDVVHDAFIELYRRWDDVDSPGAYLRRAVVNRALSWQRHAGVAQRHLLRTAAAAPSVDAPEPLWERLDSVTADQRAALVLVYYLDLTSESAADLLRVRPATVRSLVRRGLRTLRKEQT
jgi:RNA polymerase sigma factor (sigma-70 family)